MSLTFNTPHESRINTLPFTAHKEKDYPYFSYIYTINVKNKLYFKLNASQFIHFPIQPTLPLTFKTSDNELIFPSTPHPFFNTRFNSTFNSLQVYQNVNTEPSSCSVIIQNITHHSAILAPGYIGYFEVPATNIQPTQYKVNDVNSLIHTVFHSYYPDLSEPKPLRRRSSLRNPQFEINNLQPSQILTRSSHHYHIHQTLNNSSINLTSSILMSLMKNTYNSAPFLLNIVPVMQHNTQKRCWPNSYSF